MCGGGRRKEKGNHSLSGEWTGWKKEGEGRTFAIRDLEDTDVEVEEVLFIIVGVGLYSSF
jgi:hypothetical protein